MAVSGAESGDVITVDAERDSGRPILLRAGGLLGGDGVSLAGGVGVPTARSRERQERAHQVGGCLVLPARLMLDGGQGSGTN